MIAQYVASLISCAWSGSKAFSLKEATSNALLGYYILLVQTFAAFKKHGRHWSKHFLPAQTVRSMMDLCGHIVLASHFWPVDQDLGWNPSAREECSIERYFGRIKAHTRGNPSLKDCLYGATFEHAKNLRMSESLWGSFQCRIETPLGQEELQQMAEQALGDACVFQASGIEGDPMSICQCYNMIHQESSRYIRWSKVFPSFPIISHNLSEINYCYLLLTAVHMV